MALEGPQLRFTRDADSDDTVMNERETAESVTRALRLARQVEELLEHAPSVVDVDPNRAHSTRMARAMAASLVDELEAIVKGSPKSGIA
jgi:hypothetical protein